MSKYNAKKVTYDGIDFDSTIEKDYYVHLKESGMQMIVCHPRYLLQESFRSRGELIRPIYLEADFEYRDSNERVFVVDVKGMATSDAKLKRKLFLHRYDGYTLLWVTRYKGLRVDFFANEGRKRENKKNRLLNNL